MSANRLAPLPNRLDIDIRAEKASLEEDEVDLESSSDDSEDEEFRREWDSFEKTEKQQATMSKYQKHDLTISSRMNACKLVSNALNMNISTGDVGKRERIRYWNFKVCHIQEVSLNCFLCSTQVTQVTK